MRRTISVVAICAACLSAPGPAPAQTVWNRISDSSVVEEMFSGKTAIMYKTRKQFYRADGVMVEYFPSDDYHGTRGWMVREDAKVCWVILSDRDRVVDCAVVAQSSEDPQVYRYEWENAQGKSPFSFIDRPTEEMIKALNAEAGPLAE